ncbi:hypothetical protein MBLNU457_6457t1 [Dothideomycetes sp. NU457]
MSELLTITSASGKQASHLIPHLYQKQHFKLRLVVRSQRSKDRLSQQYPEAEVTTADLSLPADCDRILDGATAVYYIGPIGVHETQMGYHMIDASVKQLQNGNFKHFVFSSVLNTQLRKLLNHDGKRYVEEYLMESDLNYTILSPSNFMDQFNVPKIAETGTWSAPWNPEQPFAQTALCDLGEAGAKVLFEREKHYFAQYQIVSTLPKPYLCMIEEIERQLGRKIEVKRLSHDEAFKTFVPMAAGEDASPAEKEILERLVFHYNRHSLKGNPNTLRWLLGREPTDHAAFVRMGLEKAKQ